MVHRVALAFALFSVSCMGLELTELQKALQKRDADWRAGSNPVTELTGAEQEALLGAPLPAHFDAAHFGEVETPEWRRKKYPAYWDWRNHQGTRYASPILNQGRCGSCVAFAAIYQLETQMNIANQTVFNAWEFSPQHLFACGGGRCERGWQPGSAASYLKKTGVPDEACFPYQSGALGTDMACSQTCSDSPSRATKVVDYSRPTYFFSSVSSIKKALQKGPLMTVFKVYEDFLYYQSGVYKHVTGSAKGGHAVTIVGWNDADRAWIVANSWGPSWGEKGFFRISWDDTSGLGKSTYAIVAPKLAGYLTPGDIRDGQILNGRVQLSPQSTFPGTQRIEWQLSRGTRSLARGAVVDKLETTDYPDGMYEIRATAYHDKGKELSAPRRIGILNGPLQGSLHFLSLNPGQTVKGKLVLEIEAKSFPVDFEEVEFIVTPVSEGANGLSIRTTNIAQRLKLSWRSKKIPNGEYDVSLVGRAGDKEVISQPIRVGVNN